jgi:hypothetical protein
MPFTKPPTKGHGQVESRVFGASRAKNRHQGLARSAARLPRIDNVETCRRRNSAKNRMDGSRQAER